MAALAALLVAASVLLMLPRKTEALQVYYDKIHYYGIEANLLDNGAVEFIYTFDWEVVIDVVDEPFKWVKIGIPNSNAHKFKALTDNIKSVKYMSDYGSYAKVKFRKTYHAGDVIHFSFSFVQENLFETPDLYGNGGVWSGLYVYDYTPGWFDEIPVEKYEIKWNVANVVKYTNNARVEGQYLVCTGSLKAGERANIVVGYRPGSYSFQYKDVSHFWTELGAFTEAAGRD